MSKWAVSEQLVKRGMAAAGAKRDSPSKSRSSKAIEMSLNILQSLTNVNRGWVLSHEEAWSFFL